MDSNYKNSGYNEGSEGSNSREIKENNLEKSTKDDDLEVWKLVAGIALLYAVGTGGCLLGNYLR